MKYLIYILPLCLYLNSQAATFTSAQTGDFLTASTWNEAGVPGYGDIIIINDNHIVTLTATGDITLTGSLVIHEKGELIVEIITDGGGDLNTLILDGNNFQIMGKFNFVPANPAGSPPTVGKDLTVQGSSFLWFHESSEIFISDDMHIKGNVNIVADACVDIIDDLYFDGTGSKLCGASNISIGKFSASNIVVFQNGANSNQICINSNVKRGNNFGPCGPDAVNGNVNFNPVANDDIATVDQGVMKVIDVLDQGVADSDLLGDPLEIISAGSTFLNDGLTKKGGTVVINKNGTPSNVSDDFIEYISLATYAGQDTFFYAISDGNGGFSDALVAVTVQGTLPVELSSFRAIDKSCNIDLEWVTQYEENNHFFEVERSEDGKIFKTVGRVNGVGNSNTPSQYSFTDKLPNFSNYYRLKQWDLNGEYSYSEKIYIESICIDDGSNIGIVKTFPNPVMNNTIAIRFDALEETISSARISDLYGKHVLSTTFEIKRGMNHFELNLDILQAGTYFLTVDKKTTRFIKITD